LAVGLPARTGLRARPAAAAPSLHEPGEAEGAEADPGDGDDPDGAKDAVVRRNGERLGAIVCRVLRDDLVARLARAHLLPDLVARLRGGLARAGREEVARARAAHAAERAEDGALAVALDVHRSVVLPRHRLRVRRRRRDEYDPEDDSRRRGRDASRAGPDARLA